MRIFRFAAIAVSSLFISAPGAFAATVSFQQISPTATDYEFGVDWREVQFSAPGDVTAPLQDLSGSAVGCDAVDFAGFSAGNIALIARGDCLFSEKANNAIMAGAAGVIFYNNVPGINSVSLGELFGSDVVAVIITQSLGVSLLEQMRLNEVIVRLGDDDDIGVVPLPAAAWMFGAGLAGLGLAKRRRRRA